MGLAEIDIACHFSKVQQGNITAGIERDDIVGDLIAGFEKEGFGNGIDAGGLSENKRSPLLFHDMPGSESDIIRCVGFSQHAGSHTGVIVVCRGAHHGDPVTFLHKGVKLCQGHHMGMSATNENEMFGHFNASVL